MPLGPNGIMLSLEAPLIQPLRRQSLVQSEKKPFFTKKRPQGGLEEPKGQKITIILLLK